MRLISIIVSMTISVIAFLLSIERETPEETDYPRWSAVELLKEYHGEELTDFDRLTLAIALTESRFDPSAVGSADDYGILQIRAVYVEEVNRVSGTNFSHEDAFDIGKSIDIFNAMNEAKNPQRSIDKAIALHNKSADYKRRVLANLETINRYEEIRARLVER